MNISTSNSACSVRFWSGFNSVGPYPTDDEWDLVCIKELRRIFTKLETDEQFMGWQGGGLEMLLGHESNSENADAKSHHTYHTHSGHHFKRIIEKLELGRVHIGPWTSGDSDSGSQMRTVVWDLIPTAKWKARLDELRAEGSPYILAMDTYGARQDMF